MPLLKRIHYNAPVILTFFLFSLAALLLGAMSNGWTTQRLFSVYRAPLTDPLKMCIRDRFSTRMASADREAIKELAKRSGMSMSDYVTACCLGKQVVVIDGLKEVLKELKSIGRNLNQLVTLAHMGRITVINLDSVRQAFSELCAAVRLILERKRW